MPVCPGWYDRPQSIDEVVAGFVDRVLQVLGIDRPGGWRAEELTGEQRALPRERVPD